MDSYKIVSFQGKDLTGNYKGLVTAKWLHSLRHGNSLFKRISHKEYYQAYNVFLNNLLNKPSCIVQFAVLSDDPDVILGFSVCREDVLDYVHVHRHHRGLGIARKLIPAGTTTFSHITKSWIPIWQEKFKEFKFNPFA
jgi:GNAT superfamily N-acetyltransferase